jgi:manganese transport protein
MKKTETKSLSEVHESVQIPRNKGFFKTLFAFAGPAYLVSVGYMDPGNWATDLAGGSRFGYQLIWVLLMSNLMAQLLQSLSARLGLVKGWDLAQASRHSYPKVVNFSLYVLAEVAIAACDLAEVIGMAIGLNLLFDLPLIYGVSITVFDTFLMLYLLNRGMRRMEAFILSMVMIIGLAFLAEMFIVKPVLTEVLAGFKPSALNEGALYIAIGIIGATVMPHNLYLHSSLVQTRRFDRSESGIKKALKFNFIDSTIALNLAFLVNAAILILAAAAFHQSNLVVDEIQDAHLLLSNIFGSLAPALFAIALIASGQSSTITGTLAGQIIMEGYLNLRIRPWLRRLLTRLIAIVPAFFTILYLGEESLGALLILSQVILSLQLGFAVIPLIHFASSKLLMGSFAIKPWVKIASWITAAIILTLNIRLVIDELTKWISGDADHLWIQVPVLLIVCGAGVLLVYIIIFPLLKFRKSIVQEVPHGVAVDLKHLEQDRFSRIAITVDFSKQDENTISHALSQGGKEAEYLVVHIVETAGARALGSEIDDLETQSDKQNLEKYVRELQQLGYKANYSLGYGDAVKVIPELTGQFGAGLLVMGAHGHKGIKDIIFGATVDSVRHSVSIPVLIVKRKGTDETNV